MPCACIFFHFIGKFVVSSSPSILTVFVNIVLSPKVSLGSLQEESCLQFIFRNGKIALLFLETVKLHFKPVPRSALLYG